METSTHCQIDWFSAAAFAVTSWQLAVHSFPCSQCIHPSNPRANQTRPDQTRKLLSAHSFLVFAADFSSAFYFNCIFGVLLMMFSCCSRACVYLYVSLFRCNFIPMKFVAPHKFSSLCGLQGFANEICTACGGGGVNSCCKTLWVILFRGIVCSTKLVRGRWLGSTTILN